MSKHPGTSGLMPVKGSTCGIRPDLDAMNADTGFDFSQAQQMLQQLEAEQAQSSAASSAAPTEEPEQAQIPSNKQQSPR